MIKQILFLLLFIQLFGSKSFSQTSNTYLDFALASNTKAVTISGSADKFFFLRNDHLILGYGIRLNQHFSQNQTYLTAPFKYTKNAQFDSLQISKASSTSLGLKLNLGYALNEKISVGFNIDVIGLSFGGQQNAVLIKSIENPLQNKMESTVAKPSSANVLLVGDNDIGSLNSEFFVRYNLKENIGIRIGSSFFFSEYTTELAGYDGNKRFRNKILSPFIALNITL